MRKFIFILGVIVATLTGCNNDVDTDDNLNLDKGEIAFNAFVPKMTRGENTTTESLQTSNFYVFAYNEAVNGVYAAPFMDDVTFSFNSAQNNWISSPIYYWPQNPLDFYAYYPNVMSKGSLKPDSFNYTVAPDAKNEVDVVMSYAAKQSTPKSNNPLNLKFHHALSKVNFIIKTKGASNLNVTVNSVSVKNVFMQGDIAYQLNATTMPYFVVTNQASLGSPINTPTTPIVINAGSDNAVNPASALISGMFLMPQTLTCWKYSDASSINMTGTYINISGSLTGVTEYTGDIAIPITTSDWMPGYSYTYTIMFGDGGSTGGGGYNPNKPNPNSPEKPTPILVPITINVTVDQWIDITPNPDIDL